MPPSADPAKAKPQTAVRMRVEVFMVSSLKLVLGGIEGSKHIFPSDDS